MDDTWYYTLSTIAQTLAAILGLAAVFAAIRLENFSKQLKEYRDRGYCVIKIIDKHLKRGNSTSGSANGVYKELEEIEKNWETYEENSGIKPEIEEIAKRYETSLSLNALEFIKDSRYHLGIYIKQRKGLLNKIKQTGVISSGTIIYAILLLSISKLFWCDRIFAMQLFTLAIVLSILSIILIIDITWKILKDIVEKI